MALIKAIATPPGKPTKHVAMTPQEEAKHLADVAAAQAQMKQHMDNIAAERVAAQSRLEAAGFNLDLLDDIKKLIS